ncbi:MAG: DNA replication and repair protein RecF [Victivallales bacterium]|nr:DNA replication and repair protein RecF [Victivallales bacterium]
MLRSIDLFHYRNIDDLHIELLRGVNAFIGSNGQGKTNILEGIYYLSLLRSFRTSQINDLKQWKSPLFRLHGLCSKNGLPDTELEVVYGTERKLSVNGNAVYRTSEFINHFICITFIPQDMELIRGGDALRRRFMDIAISQSSDAYLKTLQAYHEALKSRNLLLKDRDRYDRRVITAYDAVLVQTGVQLELARRAFTDKLNAVLSEKSNALIEDGRMLSVKYLSGIGTLLQTTDDDQPALEQRFMENLDKNYERDCREGFTHCGPHRAELSCLLNGTSLLHFGSEGECRMASLAIKLACVDIIKHNSSNTDVTLLVDDVIGELDNTRQSNFFSQLMDAGQIVLAGTFLPEPLASIANVMHIQGGKIVM